MKTGRNGPRQGRAARRVGLACAVWLCVLAQAGPVGRELLRNGDFAADAKRPRYWATPGNGVFANFTIEPAEQGAGHVLAVEVLKSSQQPWAAQLRQSIDQPLKRGQTLYLSFEYKISENYLFHCYWQREAPPWPKYMSVDISSPVGEWRKCTLAVRVPEDLAPRSTSFCLHLAARTGKAWFRNFSMTLFPKTVAPEDLAVTSAPVLGGDEVDEAWRQAANARLEKVRKNTLRVRVLHQGRPVAGAQVALVQKTRDFFFGVEVPGALFDDKALAELPEFAELRKRTEGVRDAIKKYRATVLDPRLFNMISLRDSLFWRLSETGAGPLARKLVPQFADQGLLVRGQALYCPAFRFCPPRCRQMGKNELQVALNDFISAQVAAFKGRVLQWDVVYAAATYDEIYGILGPESLVRAFQLAREADPDALLVLRDDVALSSPDEDRLRELLAMTEWLKQSGAPIQAIALDARMGQPYIAPSALESRLNRVAKGTGLPLAITAFQVNAPTEANQAQRVGDLLTLFFSLPAVNWVSFSGIWDAEMTDRKASLFRGKFVSKPAAKLVRKLLGENWWTTAEGTTDADGLFKFTGFRGTYEVNVKSDAVTGRTTVTVSKGDGETTINL
ncbi:MAG: hypothetical protein GXP31_13210 [Kiritimatiellaeota bacterium]|nr:hypothetical protein [Kiritimatiellota bacterium]